MEVEKKEKSRMFPGFLIKGIVWMVLLAENRKIRGGAVDWGKCIVMLREH